MPSRLLPFATLINRLAHLYGEPAVPAVTEPFEMILWENVAYLTDDAKRAEAFTELRTKVGLAPEDVRKTKESVLLAIAGRGILAANSVEKLRRAAEIARDGFDDDLASILDKPLAAARKDLRKFPAIGEPAAEKILLFNQRHAILALESNGLRVLVRLGYTPHFLCRYAGPSANLDSNERIKVGESLFCWPKLLRMSGDDKQDGALFIAACLICSHSSPG